MVNYRSSSAAAGTAIGAAQDTLSVFVVVGVLLAILGRDRKVEETQGLNGRCNKWGPDGL
jgi:hypothetical protein